MKTDLEVQRELWSVRSLLKKARATGDETDFLYGAQQALGWVLGQLRAPSNVEQVIQILCKDFDSEIAEARPTDTYLES